MDLRFRHFKQNTLAKIMLYDKNLENTHYAEYIITASFEKEISSVTGAFSVPSSKVSVYFGSLIRLKYSSIVHILLL